MGDKNPKKKEKKKKSEKKEAAITPFTATISKPK